MKILNQPGTEVAGISRDRWLLIVATTVLAMVVGATVVGMNWIAVAALLVIPILVLRPRELCFGAYAFLLPFDTLSAVGPGGVTLTMIAGAAVASVFLGHAIVNHQLRKPPREAVWWALFVAWAAVTVLWALDGDYAMKGMFTAFSLLLLYLIVLSTNMSGKELRTISLFAVAGGCAAALYTTVQFFRGANYGDEIRGSLMSGDSATDPNYLAASFLLPLSFAVSRVLTPGWWLARLGWTVVSSVLALGILVTGSRGSMVAIVVMILFYAYTKQVSRRMTIPIVVIFVALMFVLPESFFTRLQSTADSGGSGRTVIWQGGLVAFEHYALAGAGLNSFGSAYREYVGSAPLFHHRYIIGAHNIYLQIAVEMGIIGIGLLFAAVVGQLRAASRCRKNQPPQGGRDIIAFEAACYAILVSGFFLGVIWEKWFWLAWMLLALAVRTTQAAQRSGTGAVAVQPAPLNWYDSRVRSHP